MIGCRSKQRRESFLRAKHGWQPGVNVLIMTMSKDDWASG